MTILTLTGVRKLLRVVRLSPFDTATPEGRAQERHRRVIISAAASATAKVASSVVTLMAVPMLLAYLGVERFGIWITITSFLALLAFSDLGIGNGLLTAISQVSGRGDHDELRRYVTSGLAALVGIALALLGAFAAASIFVPWAELLNVRTPAAAEEVGPAITVLGIGLAASIPAGVAMRVQMGLQQGFTANLFQIVGSLFTLVGLVLAVRGGAGLPWLVAASVGGPLLAAVCNSVLFFGAWRTDLCPVPRYFSGSALRQVVRLGLLFFVLQIALAIGMSTDNLILSHFLGPEAVAQYAIPAKLFGLVSIAMAMAMNPLWPAYGEATARGDRAWVRRTLLRSMRFVVGGGIVGLTLLMLALPTILDLWVGGKIQVSFHLMLALAVWTLIECWGGSVAMYLNGTGAVRFQVFVALAFALACVGARVAIVGRVGLPGIPWGAVVGYVLTVMIPCVVFLRTRLRADAAGG